jgi:hypothetical protein
VSFQSSPRTFGLLRSERCATSPRSVVASWRDGTSTIVIPLMTSGFGPLVTVPSVVVPALELTNVFVHPWLMRARALSAAGVN